MQRYTPEQRKQYAEHICTLVRTWLEEKASDFEFEFERGVEWCADVRSGDRKPRANPTITLTLKINGGAQETEGPPIVPTPMLFRGPSG
jgi:hypothetical protein